MKFLTVSLVVAVVALLGLVPAQAQETTLVTVTIENISPENGVALTPVWAGFHSGSFDSYNGGLRSLRGLERVAEDGNNSVISQQFLNFDSQRGGYSYIDNSGNNPKSRLVRTGDLTDAFRQDATIGAAPLRPGDTATSMFELRTDGSNDFFSYVSMVLPTNDFFTANGSPVAHDIGDILDNGGEISFFIGTPNGGVNDAGTEREDFRFSAGNPLFEGRNLPAGQSGPNRGRRTRRAITNVEGEAFADFRLISTRDQIRLKVATIFVKKLIHLFNRFGIGSQSFVDSLLQQLDDFENSVSINVDGLDFNEYQDGIARVTISAVPVSNGFSTSIVDAEVADDAAFLTAAEAGNLYFNIHTADFPGGEIRGQLDTVVSDKTVRGLRILTLSAVLDSAQEPNGTSDSEAMGMGTVKVTVSSDGRVTYNSDLTVTGIQVDELVPVAVFSAIHLHDAPRGQNGGVLQDIIVDAGGTPTDFSVLEEN